MKKDIIIPVVEEVYIAAVQEWNKDFTEKTWYTHIINNRSEPLETVLILSRGSHEDGRKTSNLRHAFKVIPARSVEKIELINEDVFSFTNEYMVSFFLGETLYDKRFVFEPHSITASKGIDLPVMTEVGVLAV